MPNLPVIVASGGINTAGRSSQRHAHNRLVINSINAELRNRTIKALGVMMDSDIEDEILARTLVRRIEHQHFDPSSVAINHRYRIDDVHGVVNLSPDGFTTSRAQNALRGLSAGDMVLVPTQREFDVIIFGATGFTGRLACEYMHSNYKHVAWAVAARNASKAKQHLADIGADNVKVLTADALDPANVQGVVQRTRTIANFAGTPFLDKALPVVMACARYGTHYVDITGEVSLHRASYERYHRSAVASKALIMHGLSCPLCRSSVAR